MKRNKPVTRAPEPPKPLLAPAIWKWTGTGAALTAAGLLILTQADTAASNWASHLAPVLILGGYAVMALALWKSGK